MTHTDSHPGAQAKLRAFPQGKRIFKEGDAGKTMYVVLSGEVELQIGGKIVDTVRKGGVLGEMALLGAGTRSATAVARRDCTLQPIAQKQFAQVVKRSPEFSIQIMQTIADRLRKMNRTYRMPGVAADAQAKKIRARNSKSVK